MAKQDPTKEPDPVVYTMNKGVQVNINGVPYEKTGATRRNPDGGLLLLHEFTPLVPNAEPLWLYQNQRAPIWVAPPPKQEPTARVTTPTTKPNAPVSDRPVSDPASGVLIPDPPKSDPSTDPSK